MEDNSQQAQFPQDSLAYRFLNNAELMRALTDMNIEDLRALGAEFQNAQHCMMLAINPADKDSASLAIAVCRGANDFVYWLEAVKTQIKELEIAGKEQ